MRKAEKKTKQISQSINPILNLEIDVSVSRFAVSSSPMTTLANNTLGRTANAVTLKSEKTNSALCYKYYLYG